MAILRGYNLTLATGQALDSSWTSDILDTAGYWQGSFDYSIPTGTHVGVLTLLAGGVPDATLMVPQLFITNAGAAVTTGIVATVTAGNAFAGLVCISNLHHRYYCLGWVPSAGTGTITVYTSLKNRWHQVQI